jgi:DNA-binding MarR family transcriptional regulator
MSQSSAIDSLVHYEVVGNRTGTLETALGCLACRWRATQDTVAGPHAGAGDIARCTGQARQTFHVVLKRLLAGKAIDTITEPRRRYYVPADTEQGREFARLIEPPATCGLEKDRQSSGAEHRDQLSRLLETCTPEDLQWVIEEASARLSDQTEQQQ